MAKKRQRPGLNEQAYLKGITEINRNFTSHEEQGMLSALGNVEDWKHGFELGRTWQSGNHVLVIALANGGKRCIKVMGKVPDGVELTPSGLKAVYNAWITGNDRYAPSMLSDDRVRAIAFAAALDGDAAHIDFGSYDVEVP